ncbi:anthranilate phosphoribosyltransferase [Reinekea marina]|uniref:Anthranilate phosphoribosyltransferase n=1 Tax=Reinekea marina TaxID=1310421 RepID=A0ABV7WL37_9GAMM|nr:anthranilate phosphoribosyltransferase [Reinekea marina]MDN3650784.1 anthranilate phosphoribosyltransferase [Reinekea marina]
MDIKKALNRISMHGHLDQEEMKLVMKSIMTGECTDAQIGAFLMGLRMKGETVDEISGAAQIMRELATKVVVSGENLVDTCGTGGVGDAGQKLFNVSTATAFVVAAAGGRVAKHGNRAVSSTFGSADVLEAAGVRLDVSPEVVARAIETIGVGFMFAQNHHSAMRHAIGPRKELGLRTIFNMLGPLTNPAGVKRQVMGVFSEELCEPLAQTLGRLGAEHVMVIHSKDGLDEFSLAAPTHVAEYKEGRLTSYNVEPEDFGLASQGLGSLKANNVEESLAIIKGVFSGESTDQFICAGDLIALNAGAAIYVSGVASSFEEGVALAQDVIASGQAGEKLNELVDFTQTASA